MGTTGQLLDIQSSELKFPFELRKHSSCSLQLTNKTDQYVAFKVKTTNPKKYYVRPNMGIVTPGAMREVSITMQAQEEAPLDMHCKDKFLLQSVVTNAGSSSKDITPEMFIKEAGKIVEEFKLGVVYIPKKPPSPVPEGTEVESSPSTSVADNGNQSSFMFDADFQVSRSTEETKPAQASSSLEEMTEETSEAWTTVSILMQEKTSAIQQNQRLQQEMELLRKKISRERGSGFSVMFILLVGLVGVVLGYLVKMS